MAQAEEVKQSEQHEPQLIRVAEVCRLAGLSKSSIWRLMAEGRFPRPTRLGTQCTRWNKPEVIAWVEQRLAARPAAAQAKLLSEAGDVLLTENGNAISLDEAGRA